MELQKLMLADTKIKKLLFSAMFYKNSNGGHCTTLIDKKSFTNENLNSGVMTETSNSFKV